MQSFTHWHTRAPLGRCVHTAPATHKGGSAPSIRHWRPSRSLAAASWDDDPNSEAPAQPKAFRQDKPTSGRQPRAPRELSNLDTGKPSAPNATEGTHAAAGPPEALDAEDDPNMQPEAVAAPSSTTSPEQQTGPRRGTGQRGNKRSRYRKPTADELRARGYDDVDDFPDADTTTYEPMHLREDDPMYVPALTDEDLAEDPPDHKSGYVAVIGRPNAGKSTLINTLVGQKLSIVSYKPQTTRHRIMGIASDTHYQMVIFDTPGIINVKRNKLEERMMAAVVGSIQDSEAIIAVVDSDDNPKDALAMFQPGKDWSGPPMAVLLNKADLLQPEQLAELETWYKENCRAEQVFHGSAKEGTNVQAIKEWAVSKLPLGPTLYSKKVVSEQPQRFFAAELIREQIFFQYSQEVPYSCQVQIADWRERPSHMKLFIRAVIMVDKESQKAILIGAQGAAIKKLGSAARAAIETFLEQQVYLELGVECAAGWRDNKDSLAKFGYMDPMLI